MALPPPEVNRTWREDVEAGLAKITYGQIVLKIQQGKVIRVEFLEAFDYQTYIKKPLDAESKRA